jgi:uncharacterized protein with PIN domain
MAGDRDPFVEKFTLRERAEEDLFFGRRDAELLRRLRAKRRAVEERRIAEAALNRCPQCGESLREVMRRGVRTEVCPRGHGFWVALGACKTIIERERNSWFERTVHLRW